MLIGGDKRIYQIFSHLFKKLLFEYRINNKEVIQSEKNYSKNNFGDLMFLTYVETANAYKKLEQVQQIP